VAEAALAAAKPAAAEGAGRIAVGIDLTPVEPGALVLVGQQVIGRRALQRGDAGL